MELAPSGGSQSTERCRRESAQRSAQSQRQRADRSAPGRNPVRVSLRVCAHLLRGLEFAPNPSYPRIEASRKLRCALQRQAGADLLRHPEPLVRLHRWSRRVFVTRRSHWRSRSRSRPSGSQFRLSRPSVQVALAPLEPRTSPSVSRSPFQPTMPPEGYRAKETLSRVRPTPSTRSFDVGSCPTQTRSPLGNWRATQYAGTLRGPCRSAQLVARMSRFDALPPAHRHAHLQPQGRHPADAPPQQVDEG